MNFVNCILITEAKQFTMKKIYTLFTAIFLCLTFVQAQCPKFCFFEDFTQAGCSPCALGNSFFQPNILTPNPTKVHLVSYHCYWPGTDPMYANNTTGNDDRTFFYGVNAIPQMRMCGNRKISDPADFSQLDVDNIWNEGSPLKISVTQVDNGNNRDATVTIQTIGNPPAGNYKLYCAVIQHDTTFTSPPGQNGETFFPDVFREMLPSDNGISITIPTTGNSITVGPFNFLEDQAFWVNPNKIEVVAFIQNVNTREIIQCGSTIDPPTNEMMTHASPDFINSPASVLQTFPFTCGNSGNASEQYNFTLTSTAPAGWTSSFTVNSNTYTSSTTLTIPASTIYPASISVTPNANHGVGKYTLTMTSVTNPTAPPMFINVYVMSGVTDLIVNNANTVIDESILGDANNWSSVYKNGLAAAGCTSWGNLDDQHILIHAFQNNQMTGVNDIYFNVGYTYISLPFWSDSVLVPELTTFLNGGGRLFMSGQQVAYFMDGQFANTASHNFMHNMMGTHYTQWGYDVNHNWTLATNTSDAVFGAVPNSAITNYYGMNPAGYPNYFPGIIHDTLLGNQIFYYNADTTKGAGVRTTNGIFKTVFISPGIEMLGSAAVQNQILALSYYWFNGTLSVEEYDAAMKNISLGQNYPNPGNSSTTIPFTNVDHDMRLQVLDLQGRIVVDEIVNKGAQNAEVSLQGLEEGIYLYRLIDGNSATETKLMQVVK
jgi:hypothetical protein